jgi:16S rRNA (cytidine1402-2'-O)-methyltransferase
MNNDIYTQKGTLFVVATPIGNLEDITFRAVRTLREVDGIACEDTRVTKRLLDHYDIYTKMVSYHHHSSEKTMSSLLNRLESGENIALVTDAGTPGISDPGNMLVKYAIDRGIAVSPIPGASALSALLSVAGIDTQRFFFLGFVPHKKGRKTFFERVASSDVPVMYFDSVHRVVKNLDMLGSITPDTSVIVGRELTKMFEEIVRGTVLEVLEYFREHPEKVKGEFVVLVEK